MSKQEQKELENNKVFFITSNQSKLDNYLTFEASTHGLVNLRAGINSAEYKSETTFKRENFSIYINSMEIMPKELNKNDQDSKTQNFNGLINLKTENYAFPGNFSYMPSKNNFIYDFEFTENKGLLKNFPPPPQIKFSKLEQLKLYISYMKALKKKQSDKIYQDLITSSMSASFDQKISLDFYLEILNNGYS